MHGTGRPEYRWWCALALAALLQLAAGTAFGQSLCRQLLDDARDGELEGHEFLAAALIASGADEPSSLAGWLAAYEPRRARFVALIRACSPGQRLEAIHSRLHEWVLTGNYQPAATDLRLTLADGDFNCLSAVALYFDLCQALEIDAEIWLGRGHVFLRADADGKRQTIEPGARTWRNRDRLPAEAARRITPVELVGKFYYNRGVELVQERQFAAGIKLLEASLQHDAADGDAKANLAAGLNNWAVERLLGQHYAEAAALIEQGLRLDARFAPLVANQQLVRAKLGQ